MLDIRQSQNVPLADASLPPITQNQEIPWKITFASRSELACALTMERYIPGWRCIPGVTYEIDAGHDRKIDFRVHDYLVEFHPIVLRHEFRDSQSYHQLTRALSHVHRGQREEVFRALHEEFGHQYYHKRRILIEHTPELKDLDLIVCADASDFYTQVICRFAGRDAPKRREFITEFNALLKVGP